MSINSALAAGVSGLMSNSSALASISDNIANVNTVGYKRVETLFSPNYKVEAGGNSRYSSSGVTSRTRLDMTTEGLFNPSTSQTDLSIDGEGFFLVRGSPAGQANNDPVLLTRAGGFETDSAGYLRNDAGHYLYGWPVASDGSVVQNPSNVDELEAINLANIGGAAEATSRIRINANLQASQVVSAAEASYDPAAPANNMASGAITADFERTIQIYDSQGGLRSVKLMLMKSSTPNQWHAEIAIEPASDVTTGGGLNSGQIATGVIAFDTNGQIDTANTTLPSSLNLLGSDNAAALGPTDAQWGAATGVGAQSLTLDIGSAGNPGGITQYDNPSVLNSTSVNGALFGEFAGVEVSDDGFVSAKFTNGVTRRVYQIPVATVTNPNGLASTGGGAYQVTDQSGTFTLNPPGDGRSGRLAPQTLENSNVDLATEFSNLIITQRAYAASSRIISTADEMLEETLRMKR